MDIFHNQNYTREEIDLVLYAIKDCVIHKHFSISKNKNRQNNINFIDEYNIRSNMITSILLQITTDDFCHSLQNINPNYKEEVLYVFVPQVKLYGADGEEETVDVYTKFNMIKRSNHTHTIVVSFHKCSKKTEYLFR